MGESERQKATKTLNFRGGKILEKAGSKMKKVTSLIYVLAAMAMASCSNSGTVSSTKCEHTYEEKIVERTDYNQGYTLCKCSKCGYSYQKDVKISYKAAAQKGQEAVIAALKSKLKDPDSMLYDGVCAKRYNLATPKELMKGAFLYKIHYNAKNSFGGYVGYKNVYYGWSETYSNVGTASEEYYSTYYYSTFYTF